jgi:hypothetical protein
MDSATALIDGLAPLALGELAMTPMAFGNATIAEIMAMLDGYERRREQLEDLFILFSAIPIRQAFSSKHKSGKALYEEMTRYRRRKQSGGLPPIDPTLVAKWKDVL